MNNLFRANEAGRSVTVQLQAPRTQLEEVRQAGLPEVIALRFVTVRLSTGELEVLDTNLLDEVRYPTDCFGELYHHRWGIETYYGLLKGRLDLGNFTGLSAEAIRQDIYATVLVSNLESVLIVPAQQQLLEHSAKLQHPQQVNHAVSFHALKSHIMIALAKRQPGKLSFASGGTGSSNHLAGELLKLLAGVDLLHVPYKGAGPAMTDVMAGHVDMMLGAAGLAEARAGRVKVLGITSAKRSGAARDLPTLAEAGVKGYEATIWFGLLAPAGTPQPIVNRLSQEIGKALQLKSMRERFSTVDLTPTTPEGFAEHIKREMPKLRKVVTEAKITAL